MNDSDHGLNLEFNLPVEHIVTPHVDEGQLNDAIRTILQGADLEQLSRRMIRKQLETQFGMDLSEYKETINACILRIIEEQQQADEEDEPEPSDAEEDDGDDEEEERSAPSKAKKKAKAAPAKKKAAASTTAAKRKRGADGATPSGNGGSSAFNMKLSLSPELADVVGSDTMARPQIVKALWEYIREHDLQDPNNKRVILLDERLRNVFQRDSVTMFSVNKFVKRHVRKPEELGPGGWNVIHRDGVSSDEDDEGKAAKKKAAASKKKKKVASTADDEGGEKKPKKNPFNAELALSPELAVVVGSDRLARPQIVKQIWEYIRAHNLQDPTDKRTILLDDTLKRVFMRDTVTMFSLNKYIKRHAMKPENLPVGGWGEVPRDGASSDEDGDGAKSKKKAKK